MGLAALALAGCRGDRGGPPAPPPAAPPQPGRVEITLELPPLPAWNEQDTLAVTVANHTAEAVHDAILELFVAAPVAVMVDSAAPNGPSGSVTAEGTRLEFPFGTLAPGQTSEVRQAVRTPPAPAPKPARGAAPAPGAGGFTATDTAGRFLVRATLVTRGGAPLATPVQDTLRIRAGSEVAVGGCGTANDVVVTRYGVGPVRVGMSEAALRSACPEARDTSWKAEGAMEKGLVALPGGQRVVAVIDRGGLVQRIVIDQAGLKTANGFGVGAEVAELRASYGRMCAGRGEGQVAVWFPNAPGISFGLDTAATKGWGPARVHPDSVPDEVTVAALWVRQGSDDCPARPGEGTR